MSDTSSQMSEHDQWVKEVNFAAFTAKQRYFLVDPLARFYRRPRDLVLFEAQGPAQRAVDKVKAEKAKKEKENVGGEERSGPDRVDGSGQDLGSGREDDPDVGAEREGASLPDADWTNKVFEIGSPGDAGQADARRRFDDR